MKKIHILIALILFSTQLFSQNSQGEKKIEFENGKAEKFDHKWPKNKNCPDYLDCATGEIQYFEYKKDMMLDAANVCESLGVKSITLAKGKYEVDRTSKKGASVTIAVARWTPVLPKPNPVNFITIDGTNPKGESCKGYGNSCWWVATPQDTNDQLMKLIITPIFNNEVCVALKIVFPPNSKSGRGTDPIQAGF
jgi:hypothetical protein